MCSFCLHCSILDLDIFIYMLVILCTCIYYFVCIRGVLGQAVEEGHAVSTPACCTLTGGSKATPLYSWAEALPYRPYHTGRLCRQFLRLIAKTSDKLAVGKTFL